MLTFALVNSFLVTKNPENRKTINIDHCLTKATSVIYNPKTMGPGFLWGKKKDTKIHFPKCESKMEK